LKFRLARRGHYAEACGTDLRREGPLEGVAGLGGPAAGVDIRTVVVHPLVQLLAEPVVVQLDLPPLTHTHTRRFKHRKKGKKTKKGQQNPSAQNCVTISVCDLDPEPDPHFFWGLTDPYLDPLDRGMDLIKVLSGGK
jgi:hypothetical protein